MTTTYDEPPSVAVPAPPTGLVVGRLVIGVDDAVLTTDLDVPLVDGTVPASGTVTFQLVADYVPDQDPADPKLLVSSPITEPIDGDGRISRRLIATDSPTLNPPGQWYQVTFALRNSRKLPAAYIQVPTGGTVNLTDALPVTVDPVTGVGTVQGPRGVGVEGVTASGGNLLITMSDGSVDTVPIASVLNTTQAAALAGKVDKGSQTVNLLDYGAVLNGTTHDGAAWDAAYAACPAGGTLLIPRGTATNTSGVPWTVSKQIHVRGPGGIKVTNSNVPGLRVSGSAASGFTIEGVKLEGPDFAGYSAAARGIEFLGASSSAYMTGPRVHKCNLVNWRAEAIYAQFVADGWFTENTITGSAYAGFRGLSVTRCHVDENTITTVTRPTAPTDPAYGIAFMRGTGSEATDPRSLRCTAIGNTISGVNYHGIHVAGGFGITIVGNTLDGGVRSIVATYSTVSGSNALSPRVTIVGNGCTAASSNGIQVTGLAGEAATAVVAGNNVTSGGISLTLASTPAVTGSRGGNAALASLLTQLEAQGLILNSTT